MATPELDPSKIAIEAYYKRNEHAWAWRPSASMVDLITDVADHALRTLLTKLLNACTFHDGYSIHRDTLRGILEGLNRGKEQVASKQT